MINHVWCKISKKSTTVNKYKWKSQHTTHMDGALQVGYRNLLTGRLSCSLFSTYARSPMGLVKKPLLFSSTMIDSLAKESWQQKNNLLNHNHLQSAREDDQHSHNIPINQKNPLHTKYQDRRAEQPSRNSISPSETYPHLQISTQSLLIQT